MIKVLIVDDSALVRQILMSVFESDPEIEVVGAAEHPLVARQMIKDLHPDVLTLDIEMPEMDGLSFLEKIMALRPMPVVMISSLTQRGTAQTLRALELGVCDIIGKPNYDLQSNFAAMSQEILTKVKAASKARIRPPAYLVQKQANTVQKKSEVELIVIGASTGGVVALKEVLPLLPKSSPPILVVQHMPEAYTAGFADRLDLVCRVTVKETVDNAPLQAGTAYIAHGGQHLRIGRRAAGYVALHGDDELVSGHKPSVDALFQSVLEEARGKVVAVMLTGMGRDGARGMLALRRAGAFTIGQSEDSCVVYGMPRVAKEVGGVEVELPLSKIAAAIEAQCWPVGKK
jgi:two-component system, chemotaxis family, protein-glutamate methylesterase/glutaminase